jgi:hypothetical protein
VANNEIDWRVIYVIRALPGHLPYAEELMLNSDFSCASPDFRKQVAMLRREFDSLSQNAQRLYKAKRGDLMTPSIVASRTLKPRHGLYGSGSFHWIKLPDMMNLSH